MREEVLAPAAEARTSRRRASELPSAANSTVSSAHFIAPRQQAVKMYQRSNAVARLGIHARVGVNQELQQPEVALLGRHVQRSDTARRRGVGVDSRLEQQLHNLFSDDKWSQNHAASLGGAALGVKPVVLNRYVKSRKAA